MREKEKLTEKLVEKITKPGRYGDGAGLWLQVGPAGNKAWLFCYMIAGRSRQMGLGTVHTFSLVEARERAKAARQEVANGVDPIEKRGLKRIKADPNSSNRQGPFFPKKSEKIKRTFSTEKDLEALKPADKHYDAKDEETHNLMVRIGPLNNKGKFRRTFVLVTRFPGSNNPTRHSLGEYQPNAKGDLTLEKARETAVRWRRMIRQNIDPRGTSVNPRKLNMPAPPWGNNELN